MFDCFDLHASQAIALILPLFTGTLGCRKTIDVPLLFLCLHAIQVHLGVEVAYGLSLQSSGLHYGSLDLGRLRRLLESKLLCRHCLRCQYFIRGRQGYLCCYLRLLYWLMLLKLHACAEEIPGP